MEALISLSDPDSVESQQRILSCKASYTSIIKFLVSSSDNKNESQISVLSRLA